MSSDNRAPCLSIRAEHRCRDSPGDTPETAANPAEPFTPGQRHDGLLDPARAGPERRTSFCPTEFVCSTMGEGNGREGVAMLLREFDITSLARRDQFDG